MSQISTYWIKLYLEILVDSKMGTLDDRTWRRAVELFLLAGQHHQAGALPSIKRIAWSLHTTEDEILSALLALEEIGIASRDDSGNWRVTNFAKRQRPISSAYRVRAYRQRRANRAGDETNRDAFVTDACQESAKDTDSDTESDKDSDPDNGCDSHTHPPDSHIPAGVSHAEVCESLTPGQTYFVRAFKSQPNPSQLLNLAQLEKTHGYNRLTQVIDWAISSGIPPGRALRAIHTAITTWSETPPPPRSADGGRQTGALEKLRKELSGDFDA